MDEDFNYKCNQFKKNLENLINNSKLPIAVVYFIIKDIYNEIEKLNIAYLNDIALKESKELEEKLNKGGLQALQTEEKTVDFLNPIQNNNNEEK